jgi:hypothetical protein
MTNPTNDHGPHGCGARTFLDLSAALLPTDLEQLIRWAQTVIRTGTSPAQSLVTVLRAVLAPTAGLVGGSEQLHKLIDNFVNESVAGRERRGDPLTEHDAWAFTIGIAFGHRLASLSIGQALVGGRPNGGIEVDDLAIRDSGVPLPVPGTYQATDDWAGRFEGNVARHLPKPKPHPSPKRDLTGLLGALLASAHATNPPILPKDRYAHQGLDGDGAPVRRTEKGSPETDGDYTSWLPDPHDYGPVS